jgi:hypothetical protein
MRSVLSAVAILAAWTLIDAVSHRMLLQPLYALNPSVWRPFTEMSIPLIVVATLILVLVFVILYKALVRPKSFTGLYAGGLLGLALGTASGLGTYIHSPIPVALAWAWWILGIVKGLVAGAILGASGIEPSSDNATNP